MSRIFVKVPCEHCPFRTDVAPFLHPERAVEIAVSRIFWCHKTIDYDDDEGDGSCSVHGKNGNAPLLCAGALSMDAHSGADNLDGFEPASNVYRNAREMFVAYEEEWKKRHG